VPWNTASATTEWLPVPAKRWRLPGLAQTIWSNAEVPTCDLESLHAQRAGADGRAPVVRHARLYPAMHCTRNFQYRLLHHSHALTT